MANRSLGRKSDGKFRAPVDSTIVIEKGDFTYYDTNDVKPAASQADQLSEGDNQGLMASKFAGVSEGRSDSGATDDVLIDAHPFREREADCPSTTYEVGDLLGVDEAASGTALENQTLAKVSSVDAAIAVCTRREPSAVTKVRYRLIRGGALVERTRAKTNIETLAATRVLTLADAKFQALDPDGAVRNVDLPPEAASAGKEFVIKNTGVATEVITIRNDGAGTVGTIDGTEQAYCWCDGTTWHTAFGVQLT